MKSADEIKKGLEHCHGAISCWNCPYWDGDDCSGEMEVDAISYIQQKEQENAEQAKTIMWMEVEREDLKRTIQQLEAERDAAVRDIRLAFTSYTGACGTCVHCDDQLDCDVTVGCSRCENKNCVCNTCNNDYCNWQWRGIAK